MIPHITKEQAFAIDKDDPDYWFATVNGRIDKANAQQETYITADEARKLGAGNAECCFQLRDGGWTEENCEYAPSYIYRTIKQSQPEPADPTKLLGEIYGFLQSTCPEGIADEAFRVVPESLRAQAIAKHVEPRDEVGECVRHTQEAGRAEVDPHATLRAEYAEQMAEGTTGFYLWEYRFSSNQAWRPLDHEEFFPDHRYRCTDISCYVSKDGEPAVRMLRTEAQELQRQTKDTHDWELNGHSNGLPYDFDAGSVYNYTPKLCTTVNGESMTVEAVQKMFAATFGSHDWWANGVIEIKYSGWDFSASSRAKYTHALKKPNLKEFSNSEKASALAKEIFPDSNYEEKFGKEIGKLVRAEIEKYLADPNSQR